MSTPPRSSDAPAPRPDRPAPRADLEVELLDGEALVFDRARRQLHHLNAVATVVWHCCDGRTSVAEIAGDLAEAFGEPLAQVEADVRVAVEDFAARGLLDTTMPTTPSSRDRPRSGTGP